MNAALEHHLAVPRTARYYTLGGETGAPLASVWIVLHGYGQLAGEFIGYFADAASPSRLIVAPEALSRYYLVPPEAAPAAERPVGATWMTREDREHEIADYIAYLDALYAELAPRFTADTRVEVLGFSQGAATATRWSLHTRARLARLVLWGGLLPPETPLTSPALRAANLTLVLGDRDRYIGADRIAAEEGRLRDANVQFDIIRYEGGHAIKRAVLSRLAG
jgi:predicted esterase